MNEAFDIRTKMWIVAAVAGVARGTWIFATEYRSTKQWNEQHVPKLRALLEELTPVDGRVLCSVPIEANRAIVCTSCAVHVVDCATASLDWSGDLNVISEVQIRELDKWKVTVSFVVPKRERTPQYALLAPNDTAALFNFFRFSGKEIRFPDA